MYQNNLFQTDFNNNLVMPTLVLCRAYSEPIDTLDFVYDFSFKDIENEGFQIGFSVRRIQNGIENALFDEIQNLKLVYIPEWQRYYQIKVSYKDGMEESVKTVEGIHLCEAELSQLVLNGVEINTETDILRDAYAVTYIYYPEDVSRSLLHRVLRDKAPNYSIKYVSPSLCQLVRSFSINGESIDDFLRGTLATEINCIVEYDSMDRSISLYDTLKICEDCGYRGDYNDETCPKCGSSNIFTEYGQDTGIIISTKNLAQEITVDTDKDSVKTCFTIIGGDDMMDAAIRAVNPNGTNQLYAFNKSILADMPQELRDKLKAYDTLHEAKQPEYREVMQHIFDLYDEILYYETEMTAVEKISTTAAEQLNNMKGSVLGEIGVSSLSDKTSKSVVDNAVLSMARLHLADGYYVKIENSVFIYDSTESTWTGKFTVYHSSDEEDTATSTSDISLTISADYETFLQQKIDKALGEKDAYDIEKDWELYSLDYLKSFESAYQSCLEILMQQGLYEANAHSAINKQLYDEYYNELMSIQKEMKVRENQINALNTLLIEYETKQREITTELNFKNYLGDALYNTFSCYRRDDEYNNSNYISDGLTNAELLQKAEELLEAASVELYKASQEKYTVTGTISNFLLMKEFQDIRSECLLGNWIYIQTENGDVYKLRLNGISGSYSSIDQIELTFSNAYKSSDPVDALQDTIAKASSMASSYQSVARQAIAGGNANQLLSAMHKEGLNTAQYKIMNADNQKILMDEHGLLCREFDDETQTYLPEQMRIISNLMCFTDDNWKTVKQAIGKIQYTDPETDLLVEKYGVICDTLVATDIYGGKFVGGHIYSENFWRDNQPEYEWVITDEETGDGEWVKVEKPTKGTHIDLNNGSFTMANGSLSFNGNTLKVKGDGTALDIKANDSVKKLGSQIEQTASSITMEINNLKEATNTSLELLDGEIDLRIKTDEVISYINMTEEIIKLRSGYFVIQSDNFSVDIKGNVKMAGEINATSGKIGAFEIDEYGYLTLSDFEDNRAYMSPSELVISRVTGYTAGFDVITGRAGSTYPEFPYGLESERVDTSVLAVGATGYWDDSMLYSKSPIVCKDIECTYSIDCLALYASTVSLDTSDGTGFLYSPAGTIDDLSCDTLNDGEPVTSQNWTSYVEEDSTIQSMYNELFLDGASVITVLQNDISNLSDDIDDIEDDLYWIDYELSEIRDQIAELYDMVSSIKECTCSSSSTDTETTE